MKTSKWVGALALLAILSVRLLAEPPANEVMKEAKAKAGAEHKKIFLVFGAPG
jgi:hypothetical protein